MQESGGNGQMIRVAVDAMGGDYAPAETVAGGVQAARELGIEIILVGPLAEIEREFHKHDTAGLRGAARYAHASRHRSRKGAA